MSPAADRRGRVDVHTHVLARVDDGARDVDEGRRALRALREQGVHTVVATPHLSCSLAETDPDGWRQRLDDFARAHRALREDGEGAAGVRVERGVELRLDGTVPPLEREVRLGGSEHVLVEFATLELPPFGAEQLATVTDRGAVPVLAHPERYRGIEDRPDAAAAWREAGAVFQVNAGSLLGQYGPGPRRAAWMLLERGWVDLVASDHHARGEPRLDAAGETLGALSEVHARRLLRRNPRRIVEGRGPEPLPPLERPGLWERVRGLLGLR